MSRPVEGSIKLAANSAGEWCSYCGARASKEDLCSDCYYRRLREDEYEASGACLEPSARDPGGNFGPIDHTTDYRRDEE